MAEDYAESDGGLGMAHRQLRIMQWNINSVRGRRVMLQSCLASECIDVCLLQEILLRDTTNFRIAGYRLFSLPQEVGGRGLTTLVKSCIPVEQWTDKPNCGDGVEVLGIRLHLWQ